MILLFKQILNKARKTKIGRDLDLQRPLIQERQYLRSDHLHLLKRLHKVLYRHFQLVLCPLV